MNLHLRSSLTLASLLLIASCQAWAQEPSTDTPVAAPSVDKPSRSTPELPPGMKKYIGPDGNVVVLPEGAPPPEGFKPAPEGDKPKGDGKDAAKGADGKAAETGPIKRKSEPPAPPDRKEFDIKPDEQGMVQFQFRNQAWPDLLRWLAEVSGMSLDWQELPNDYVNLATQRKYSIEETRDLFNRHLLARGYTMLEFDGFIQVAKTEGINPALVPKVSVDQLSSLPPNRFVRTTFPLTSLIATEVAEELKTL